ncbi:class I SAM-dependent DNA methyltransferase [Butyrivibrio sp. MC2021]|uniref:class I SAM-dependent DNA methyltransferase n=1 Tax=Butyrivibrio sp. MC2021 TaxID=1408306 RepID=UPI00047A9410|nr:class I SAM-dependent methyltransferase [Butyrivibrio sp. MC2021]
MEAYSEFASVYDTFMDETPYDVWGDFVAGLIGKYGVSRPYTDENAAPEDISEEEEDTEKALEQERNLVVELGCGTGSFTEVLAKKGYDIMGTDISADMLNIARNKAMEKGLNIMYLEQDMRELDLYCTAGTIVSVCDSVNYVLEDDEIIETFKLVNNFLFPKGIFIFDFNTLHKYRDVIGDTTIAENREDCSFIWENYYHEEEHVNEYDLTIFVRTDEKEEIFKRFNETHYQRGYTLEEMKGFVEAAGLEFVTAIDADSQGEPDEDSERIYIVARECGK